MANSMTGFGRGESGGLGYHFAVEMKSVNHRFLEIMVKTPRGFNFAEERVRKIIQETINRGRIEVLVNVKETEEKKRMVAVDKELVLSYDNSLKELARLFQVEYSTDIFRLVSLPEVIKIEEEEIDTGMILAVLQTAVHQALAGLTLMRRQEGGKLTGDLLNRLENMRVITKEITARSSSVVIDYQERLKERLGVLLADSKLDENRLMQEVAMFADRASIEEELVRIGSHLEQLQSAFRAEEPTGRKLDFLVQELNREFNTIGSKANDLDISRLVVEGKSELEKIREQVQNIE